MLKPPRAQASAFGIPLISSRTDTSVADEVVPHFHNEWAKVLDQQGVEAGLEWAKRAQQKPAANRHSAPNMPAYQFEPWQMDA